MFSVVPTATGLEDILSDYQIPDRSSFKHSLAVRAIILDDHGQLPLLWYPQRSLYKLPGGTCQPDEAPLTTFHRKIRQKTGCSVVIEETLGTFTIHFDDDRDTHTSTYYLARVTSRVPAAPAPDYEVHWVASPAEAINVLQVLPPRLHDQLIVHRERAVLNLLTHE